MSVCLCDWHLVASQLERSDNGNTVTRDLPKWSALFHFPFVLILIGEGTWQGQQFIQQKTKSSYCFQLYLTAKLSSNSHKLKNNPNVIVMPFCLMSLKNVIDCYKKYSQE